MWGEWHHPITDRFRDFLLGALVQKGGKGSGFHGHKGRPGEVGGSSPSIPGHPTPSQLAAFLKWLQGGRKGKKPKFPIATTAQIVSWGERHAFFPSTYGSHGGGLTNPARQVKPRPMTPSEVAAANAKIRAAREAAKPAPGKIGTLVRNLFHPKKKEAVVQKGGKGSGHHGHKGIPGHRGGSMPRGAMAQPGQKPEEQPPEDVLNPPPPEWLTHEIDPDSIKNMHGGVNGRATYKAKTVDGHGVFLKVKAELAYGSFRDNLPKRHDNEHEMAAQIINNAMGKPVLFPVGYIRPDAGGKGQTWVQDLFPGKNLEASGKHVRDFPLETRNGLGLFDAVIGNLNHHGMNLMVQGDQLVAIDHGLAFPTSNEKQWGNKKGIDARSLALTNVDIGRLGNLLNRRAEVDAALK